MKKQPERRGRIRWLFVLAGLLYPWFWSCRQENEPIASGTDVKGELTLEFDNVVGSANLVLGKTTYKNSFNESYTVDAFNYFVSNIALQKADGSLYKVPDSYYLIRESLSSSQKIKLTDIPQGDYTGVNFTLGVDSTKSVSPVTERTGALDPGTYGQAVDMYWAWNSGYIFVRLEGSSPAVPADRGSFYELHTGGFGGMTGKTANNLRSVSLTVPVTATVRSQIVPVIHILADAAKVMDGPNKISLANLYKDKDFNGVHSPEPAAKLGLPDNQKGMFTVGQVDNDPK